MFEIYKGGKLTFWQRLWRIELYSLFALLVFALAVGTLTIGQNLILENPLLGDQNAWWVGTAYAFTIGFLPVAVFGAPLYCFYHGAKSFRWSWMLGSSVLPGMLLLFVEVYLGAFAVAGGLCVFLCVDRAAQTLLVSKEEGAS